MLLRKKCYVRANQAPFIDKHINKLCISLIRQAKKQFFSNRNTHDVTDNKTF